MNTSDFFDVLSKSLPLGNQPFLPLYTIHDFFKPGPQDALQSALPFYELVIMIFAFIVGMVIILYFWKMVYYMIDDRYATPYGSAPPFEWRNLDIDTTSRILGYIQNFLSADG